MTKQKKPSVIFKLDRSFFLGQKQNNLTLYSDGKLVCKLEDMTDITPSEEELILQDNELVREIKSIISENKDIISSLPKELYNPFVMDGSEDTIKLGIRKFQGSNIVTHSVMELQDYEGPFPDSRLNLLKLCDLQKILLQIKSKIDQYAQSPDIWGPDSMFA